jgi:ABC-2 type transport system permease protein
MTSDAAAAGAATNPPAPAAQPAVRPPRAGWRVVAAKELADHLLSIRFYILLLILGVAAAIPLYAASVTIRDLADVASEDPAPFLALFILRAFDIDILSFVVIMAIVAPLLGLVFAFDSVNGERSEGTLPRLLSQPIYRDDVINGKFAAGLAVISLVLVAVTLLVVGFGIARLGIVPKSSEVLRIIVWVGVTILYVGIWLAFGTLLSVVFRRAAESALVGFGVWVAIVIFGTLLASLVAGLIAPGGVGDAATQLSNAGTRDMILRLLPINLYTEVSRFVLVPSQGVATPGTIDQYTQWAQQIPTLYSVDQSLLLVWPLIVAMVAILVALFAAAYVLFLRQEVRA